MAIRERIETPTLAEEMAARQCFLDLPEPDLETVIRRKEEANPNVKKLHLTVYDGKVYKTFIIVTNKLEEPGDEVIRWQRERCGQR